MAQTATLNTSVDLASTIDCFGDSLVQGAGGNGTTITTQLAALFPGRQVNNWGIGGQTSTQVASRQGARPLTLTVAGNQLVPGSTAAVSNLSSQALSTAADTFTRYLPGHINGAPCVLVRTASAGEVYTLYTVGFGTTVTIPALATFVPDDGWNARRSVQVLWMGTNDDVTQAGVPATVLANLAACAANVHDPKRVVVVGLHTTASVIKGSAGYTATDAFNASLAATYPAFVSSLPPTTAEMTAVGYTPNAQDTTDLGNGVWPTGLRASGADTVHLTGQGYQIVGNRIGAAITAQGW